MKMSRVDETRPYLADEFLRGKQLSISGYICNSGIVLFEFATGLRAYDDSRSYKLLILPTEPHHKQQQKVRQQRIN
jgi:hypothetical protein